MRRGEQLGQEVLYRKYSRVERNCRREVHLDRSEERSVYGIYSEKEGSV
jgi:hypothetical protein